MNDVIDQLNNNPGLIAIVGAVSGLIGVLLGWILNSITDRIKYKRQRQDELEKERRERFLYKAELNANEWYRTDIENTRILEVVLCTYEAYLDREGNIAYKFPKNVASIEGLDRQICIFENTGESDINDLEVGAISTHKTALFSKSSFRDCVSNGCVSYGAYLNGRVRRGEALELIVYYSKQDLEKTDLELSVEAYYRDSRNNHCTQMLSLVDGGQASEPVSTTRKEWREHIGIENNTNYWLDSLKK